MRKKKDDQEVKKLFKSVKEVLVKKGLLKEEVLDKQKEESFISKEPKEKRRYPRLNLTRDFNRTIILRIRHPEKNENIKSFANNISCGGLCLETKRELRKNSKISLRLFFYGDKVPMMKIQAHIIWKRMQESINYCGVFFNLIKEEDKMVLSRYIESNIRKE